MGVASTLYEHPFLECKHEGCGLPMRLPQSSRLNTFPSPLALQKDETREIFVHPQCGHVYDYTRQDVRLRPSQNEAQDRPERPISFLVQWNCGAENCDTRVVVQRPTHGRIEPDELMKEAKQKWIFCSAHCPNGHPITKIPDGAWAGSVWMSDMPDR